MKRLIQGISNMLTNRSGLSTALGKKLPLAVFFLGAFLATATACLAGNPFITSIYTADPSAHVWSDGRLYVYPSRDIDPPRGCDLMDRYHVYSTDDMVTWRDEGEILRASQVPWGRPEGGFMWAARLRLQGRKILFLFPPSQRLELEQHLENRDCHERQACPRLHQRGVHSGDWRLLDDRSVRVCGYGWTGLPVLWRRVEMCPSKAQGQHDGD